MRVFIVLKWFYAESEFCGVFADQLAAETYMYTLIMPNLRVNASSKALRNALRNFEIMEEEVM